MEKTPEAPSDKTHGFNPISHHWVKKTGPTWARLVKSGVVSDPELEEKFRLAAAARKKSADVDKSGTKPKAREPKESKEPSRPSSRTARLARKVVDNHRSELDDLESDAVDEHLSELLKKGLAEYSSGTDESPERPTREVKTKTGRRIRLTHVPTQPKTLDRKSKLRAALDSDEEYDS